MKPSKISELLEKINRLTAKENFTSSTLEIDLLQQYLRELYDELNVLKNTSKQQQINEVKAILNPNEKVLLNEKIKTEEKYQECLYAHARNFVNLTIE